MKNSFKSALVVYKYLSALFFIGYLIYIVIDDYYFIETYWHTNWAEYLELWALYFLAYFMGLSVYFWLISVTVILVYHKLIKPIWGKKLPTADAR